ncbi:hypothetical protein ACFL3D_00570 [Candidatus Omnitrophota bacterium]
MKWNKGLITIFIMLLLFVVGLGVCAPIAHAQEVPKRIRFIGMVLDRSNEFEMGTYSVVIEIFDTEEGGAALFSETHTIVLQKYDRGIFTLEIGSVETLDLDFNGNYYLGVTLIDAGGYTAGELIPRYPMNSSPYMMNADRLDGIDSTQIIRSDDDDSVTGNLTITGDFIVTGSTVLIGAGDIVETGVYSTTFTIDNDDPNGAPGDTNNNLPTTIVWGFGGTKSEALEFNLSASQFAITDDVSILGDLTIPGMTTIGSGIDTSDSSFSVSSTGDTYAAGSISADGNTQVDGSVDLGDDSNDVISINGDLDRDLTFTGDTSIRTEAGNLTIFPPGNIYLGSDTTDTTSLIGDLTVPRDRLFGGTTKVMEFIDDDLTLFGDLYVNGQQLFFGLPDNGIAFANGEYISSGSDGGFDLNVALSMSGNLSTAGFAATYFRNGTLFVGSDNPSDFGDDSGDLWVGEDLAIGGDLSTPSDLTVSRMASFGNGVYIPENVLIEGVLFTDGINTTPGYDLLSINETTYISQDVTMSGSRLVLVDHTSLINPGNGQSGVLQLGVLAEQDQTLVGQDITVSGSLSAGGTVVLDLEGTTMDSWSIDSNETTNIPRLAFEDANGDEYLEFNRTEGVFHLSDNVSFSNALTLEKTLYVIGSGLSHYVNGRVHIGPDLTASTIASDTGDLFVVGDVELGGTLSVNQSLSFAGVIFGDNGTKVMGDLTALGTLFVDIILDESDGTIAFGNNTQTVFIETSDWVLSTTGELEEIGSLTADGTLTTTQEGTALIVNGGSSLGVNNATAAHQIRGETHFGNTDTLIISDSGDLPVIGSTINIGDETTDTFQVTSQGFNVTTNGAISDTDSAVRIQDTVVNVFGGLESTNGEITMLGSDPTIISNGSLSVGNKNPTSFGSTSGSMFATDDLEVSHDITIGGDMTLAGVWTSNGSGLLFNTDFTVADTLFVDVIKTYVSEYSLIQGDVMLDDDVTLALGHIYSDTTMWINPSRFGSGTVFFGGLGQDDIVKVDGSLSISNFLTIDGIIYGTMDILGTIATSFTIDKNDRSSTPTLYFYDSDRLTYFRWNDPIQLLELSEDVTVDGSVTINGDLVVEGGTDNISFFSGSDHTVQITDGILLVNANSGTQAIPTTGFGGDGDLFIEDDFEIHGNLSFGGDTTIAGLVFSDDYVGVMGPLTVTGDMDVRGLMYDGLGPALDIKGDMSVSQDLTVTGSDLIFIGDGSSGTNYIWFSDSDGYFAWNTVLDTFELLGDLSLVGDLIVNGGSYLGSDYSDKFIVTSEALNILENGTAYNAMQMFAIDDEATINGELSVTDQLFVHSSSTSQFTGTDALVSINDGNLNILSSTENVNASAQYQDDGDLFVEDDIEVGNHVSVANDLVVYTATSIGNDSYNNELYIQSAGLNTDGTGAIYDLDTEMIFDDDVLIGNEISVNDLLTVHGAGLSHFIGGRVQVGPGTHVGIGDDDGDLYVVGDMEIGTDISINGDTTIAGVVFGDDYTMIDGPLSVMGDLDIRGDIYDGTPGAENVEVGDSVSMSGDVTVASSAIYLGASSGIRFADNAAVMEYDSSNGEIYFSDDVHIEGDLEIPTGSIPGVGITEIGLGLVSQEQIDIIGDVSVSRSLTITETIYIGNALQNVAYNVIDSDGIFNPSSLMNDANDLYVAGDIEIGGNVSMGGDTTIVGVIFSDTGTIVMDDLTVRGGLFVDSIDDEVGNGLTMATDVTFYQDVTLSDSSLFTLFAMSINPDQDASGELTLGAAAQDDEIYINGDLTVLGSLSMDGVSLTVSGLISGDTGATGTINTSFLIDDDDTSDTPELRFADSNGDEYLRWNDTEATIELSDELPLDGDLTVLGDLIIQGGPLNINYFNSADTEVQVSDGRVAILADSGAVSNVSTGFNDDGDLFVEGEVEIIGDLSISGDTTIASVAFGDDYTNIQGDLTVTRDIYAGRNFIAEGELDSNGLGENDIDGYVDLGVITTQGGTSVGAFAISEDLTVVSGNIDSPNGPLVLNAGQGINQPVLIGTTTGGAVANSTGDLYVVGDIEVGGDMSLAGNLTMLGILYTTQYILISECLTVTEHLDVWGNILDGIEDQIDILDDVSITGGLSVSNNMRVGRDGTGTFAVGGSVIQAYNVIGNNAETPNGSGVVDDNDLFISGSVEIDEQIDIDGTGLNDVEGYLNLGGITTQGGSVAGALAISEDLTIVDGNIDVPGQPLKLNAGQGVNEPVIIGAMDHVGIADEGGDLYVQGDVEIRKDLSIGGDTTIAGVVFGDDYTQITGSLTVTEHLDLRGNLFNGINDTIYIEDNLSIGNDLTVHNILLVLGSGVSQVTDGSLKIGNKTPSIANGGEDMYVSGDTEIWGNLSIGGNTTIAGVVFSDDTTEVLGELTVHGHVYPESDDAYDLGSVSAEWRDLYIDGDARIDVMNADTVDINGGNIDNTIFGDTTPAIATFSNLSVDGHTELGTNNTDNITFNADIVSHFMPNANDTYDLGSGTKEWGDTYFATAGEIIWNDTERFTFDGANFTLSDDLSFEGVLNVDGTGASVIDGYLNIVSTGGQNPGDLALGGDLTVEDGARIGADGTGTIAIGGASVEAYNVIGDSGASADNLAVSTDDDLLIEGTVEIDEQIDIDGTGLNDLEGYLNLGAVDGGEGGTSQGALAISEDLTILGGNIDSSAEPLKLNIGKGSSQPVFIGATTHVGIADEGGDLFVANDIEVRGDLSIGGSTTIAGVVFGDDYTLIAGDLTVEQDVYVGRNTIVTGELDINGTGLNDIEGYVEVGNITTQGGSQPGAVAIGEDLTVVGGNIDVSTEALKLNAGKGSSQPVFIGATSHTGIADEGGDLYVPNDVEIGGQLSVSGDTTVGGVLFSNDYLRINGSLTVDENIDIRGNILDGLADDVDIKDNLSIDGDLTVFGSTKLGDSTNDGFELISSGLNVDINGVISDAGSQLIVDEDVSVTGELSVNNTLTVNGSGLSQFVNGHVQIGPGSHTGIADDDGDLYVINDVEIGGDLSIGGDTTIGGVLFTNNYLRIQGSLTVDDHVDIRGNILDGIEDDVDLQDNLSIDGDLTVFGSTKLGDSTSDGFEVVSSGLNVDSSGVVSDSSSEFIVNDDVSVAGELSVNDTLTVDGSGLSQFVNGHVQIGAGSHTGIADDDGDLYVVGDVEIRGDLSIGGDTSIAGVVFGDDYTEITGSLSVTENLDLGGYLYDSGDDVIEIRGDLSIQGNTTIAGVIFSDEYTQIEGHLTVGDDLDVRGNIFDGAGDIVEILDDVSIDGYLSVAGQIYPTIMPGTASAEFSIDVEDTTATPTLKFTDATQDETLLWNDNANRQTFELSDDLSILGELTVTNNVISFGNGASINNDNTSDVLDINSTYIAFSNDVTIGGDLTILGNGVTQIPNGRVTVGDDSGNLYAYGPGDLFVAGDAQIVGGVYAATLTGAIEADGTTEPYFVIDQGSIAETADVALYFSDDGDDYAHYIKWADSEEYVAISDDATINGNLTVKSNMLIEGSGASKITSGRVEIGSGSPSSVSDDAGDLYVTNDVEIGGTLSIGGDVTIVGVIFGDDYTQIMNNLTLEDDLDVRGRILDGAGTDVDVFDDLSISGNLTTYGGDIKGVGVTNIDLGEENTGVITMTGDVSVSGDVTISGDLSVAGEILGVPDTYVDVVGDTMTGTLYINTPAALALDIDGDIEYTGHLKNKSPVKFQDGINIVNLGGISGGQILGRDVIIALKDNISVTRDTTRKVFVPTVKFVRYTKKTPEIKLKKELIVPDAGYLQLSLNNNQHVIAIQEIGNGKFIRNVGLDGALSEEGDYKLGTTNKITYLIEVLDLSNEIEVTYTIREDIDQRNYIEHSVGDEEIALDEGWVVVYL